MKAVASPLLPGLALTQPWSLREFLTPPIEVEVRTLAGPIELSFAGQTYAGDRKRLQAFLLQRQLSE